MCTLHVLLKKHTIPLSITDLSTESQQQCRDKKNQNDDLYIILLDSCVCDNYGQQVVPGSQHVNYIFFILQPSDGGVQVLLELFGDNSNSSLIDRFVINVTVPDSMTGRTSTAYSGIFGFAVINIDLTLQCEPGYTGLNCLTIDNCTGVNCNSGTCEQGICLCTPGYTGQFCEIIVGDQLTITIHSVRNPQGKCADIDCETDRGATLCCGRHMCPESHCEYYLHYCQRPIGSAVSNEQREHQAQCDAENTREETHLANFFTFMMFSNLTRSGFEWVRNSYIMNQNTVIWVKVARNDAAIIES